MLCINSFVVGKCRESETLDSWEMLWDAICQFVPSVFYEPMNVCASKSIRTDVTYCINPPFLYLLEFLLYMLQAEVIRKNEDVLNMLRGT